MTSTKTEIRDGRRGGESPQSSFAVACPCCGQECRNLAQHLFKVDRFSTDAAVYLSAIARSKSPIDCDDKLLAFVRSAFRRMQNLKDPELSELIDETNHVLTLVEEMEASK